MPEKLIQQAKVQIQNGCPDKAEKLLLQVQKEYPAYANRAIELLATLKSVPSQRKSRQAVELENRWAGIKGDGINHPQLTKFLPDLFNLDLSQEPALTKLHEEVINKLCGWINHVDDEDWLDELIIPIQQHPDFEHVPNLDQALEKWWLERFTQQYNEIVTTVDQALKNWAVEKARQSVSTLLKPTLPTHLRNKVTQLQQNIGQVENDKQRLETQLEELETDLTDWTVVQKLMTLSQALHQVKSNYLVPQEWQIQIDTALEKLSTRTQNFIATQARACRDLLDVRKFYFEFKKLAYNDLKLDWFKQVQKTYQDKNNNELINADSITQLQKIHQAILDEKTSLPTALAEWLQQRADAVSIIINKWQHMITGVELINGIKNTVPTAFQRDRLQYQKLWQNLQDIENKVEVAATDSDFQVAATTLEPILQKYPEHQFAQNLRADAEKKRQRYRLDQALQQWDIKAFLEQCQQTTPTEAVQPYLQLAQHIHQLDKLHQAAQFSDTQEAAAWWENWHKTIAQLPQLPSPFSEQLEIIALNRRREWFEKLDALRHQSAATYHQVAQTLEKWQPQSLHFVRYYRDFNRFAWHQEATEYMAAQNWHKVQNAITQFERAGGEKNALERLKVLLTVKQAEAESLDRLVDILKEQWFLITRYLSDQVGKLLYKAIQYTWQNNDKARLSTLKKLASGIERARLLELCIKWLDIEASLTTVTSDNLLAFSKLVFVNKGRGIRYTLREPVKRLITQWQSDNDILFTWFYNAAQRIHPPLIHEAVEPLTQLTGQSQQTAADIKKHLAQLTDISDTDLAEAQTTLKAEQEKWARLLEYTDLLPFPAAQPPVAPDRLDKVNDLVDKLKAIKKDLRYLEDADLRKEKNQGTLYKVQTIVRDKLQDFSVRDAWLKRVQELEPLTRLFYISEQFKKATRRFGSNDPTYLAQRDLLDTMRRYLLELVEKFKQAKVVNRGMWRSVSKDCWTLVCNKEGGGVLLPVPNKPDLQDLCDLLPRLEQEEKQFRQALIKIYEEAQLTLLPAGAQIDVSREQYQAFFVAIPKEPPRTRRCYYLFEREACKEPMATLLKQAKDQSQLPSWLNESISIA